VSEWQILTAVIAGIWCLGGIILAVMVYLAPEGYEDENGFHYL